MGDKAVIKKEAQRLRYRGAVYYLHGGVVYDRNLAVLIPEATNGFLDLYEYFEYFPQNNTPPTTGAETGHADKKGDYIMKSRVYIEGRRNGYAPDQCGRTFTVGELIAFLEQFDEDAEVFLNNDNGYTFGSITERSFEEEYDADPEE